jgi:hypothetical protein
MDFLEKSGHGNPHFISGKKISRREEFNVLNSSDL